MTSATGKKDKIIVIVGPTASGKSDLGIRLARRFGGEIISADSRQVYRGMDIGTGKVRRDRIKNRELGIRGRKSLIHNSKPLIPYYSAGVIHWLIDVAHPRRQFSVARYKKLAKKAIRDIVHRGKIPIVVGGTGLYIDALIYDLALPKVKPNLALRAQLDKLTAEKLFQKLLKLDPRRAKTIDRHNKRRLIRALEIVISSGKPVPQLELWSKNYELREKYKTLWIGINPEKNALVKQIEKRLDERLKYGMIAEVARLHKNGLSWKKLESFGLEYRWISHWLNQNSTFVPSSGRGKIKMQNYSVKFKESEAYKKLLRDIIAYSKRQMTWFKRNKKIYWINGIRAAQKKTAHFLGR